MTSQNLPLHQMKTSGKCLCFGVNLLELVHVKKKKKKREREREISSHNCVVAKKNILLKT